MAGIRLIRGDREIPPLLSARAVSELTEAGGWLEEMPPLLSASAVSELTEAGGWLEEMPPLLSASAVSVGAFGGPHGGSPARIAHHADGHGGIIIHCASIDVLGGLPDNMLKRR